MKRRKASSTHIPQAYAKVVTFALHQPSRKTPFSFQRAYPEPQPKELESSFENRIREYMASHTERVERFEEAMLKQRYRINRRMTKMFELLKELTFSLMLEKVLVKERHSITKNVNAISLCRIEKENDEVIDENIIKRSECNEKNDEIIEEPIRTTTKEPLEEERKLIEPPEPQPVSHYLKHRINKELIEGLVENQRFNDSLLAMRLGKMECEDYHSLPKEPMRGLKHMDALVDQGSDVNVMPLSTYNRLTNEKLVETDIRLSLASQSHIYPLGIAEDVLVEVAGFVYPVDFVILDSKEDWKKPFILVTPFLTTTRAEIKFDKGILSLKSGKSKVDFHKWPELLCKFKERKVDKIDALSIVNKRILEWEERIKLHHEKELEFDQWRNKMFNNKNNVSKEESSSSGSDGNQGGVTCEIKIQVAIGLKTFEGFTRGWVRLGCVNMDTQMTWIQHAYREIRVESRNAGVCPYPTKPLSGLVVADYTNRGVLVIMAGRNTRSSTANNTNPPNETADEALVPGIFGTEGAVGLLSWFEASSLCQITSAFREPRRIVASMLQGVLHVVGILVQTPRTGRA
ncbi:MAK10-like protein [Tanacetum coccineum]